MARQELYPPQLRAARALVNWTRAELADRAEVGEQTIHRMENNQGRAEIQTQHKLRRALELAGVEFTDQEGVKFQISDMQILNGYEGFCRFYDILYNDLVTNGGAIDACGVDEDMFSKCHGDQTQPHLSRMTALAQTRNDFRMRILICEGDENYIASGYADYRWLSEKYFSPACFYVFNNYLALISFTAKPTPQVIFIRSKAFADAYRQQFQKLWETAAIPSRKFVRTQRHG
jgi:DNA-binding XRE family transcriptional regulator